MADIDELLAKARERAHGYGEKYGLKETADDYLKTTYAVLLELAPSGTGADRDAWVKRHPDYTAAIERKRNAYADWKTSETYLKLLFAQVDVYRTEQATNRTMDRAHK